MRVDYVAFGIIIDDIVFPDGKTQMGVLGGGGVQAAFGMKVWADEVGIIAGVGPDLPADALAWLSSGGIDTAGVRISDMPTPRAWQVMEKDGRRIQVFRVPGEVVGAQIGRSMDRVPDSYRGAHGFHYGIHPDQPDLDFTHELRALGGVVSIEPFKNADRQPEPGALAALLGAADLFSPNLAEAQSLVGPGTPVEMLQRFARSGARIVALRMGGEGSLVADCRAGRAVRIPAVDVPVVDPVGAGNAFCGGFLVGWDQSGDLATAGLYGSVAASFLLEQVGVPAFREDLRQEAKNRLAAIQPAVEEVKLF